MERLSGPYEWPAFDFGLPWGIPIGDWDEDGATAVAMIRGNSLLLDVKERGFQNLLLERPGTMLLN